MFAQFFISPLMSQNGAERELKNVDSEFNQTRFSDSSRQQQLFCHTNGKTLDEHPFTTFSWGNEKSLKDDPEAEGVDVRKQLWDLFERYYYARNMRLVVIAGMPLDKLQSLVEEVSPGEKETTSEATSLRPPENKNEKRSDEHNWSHTTSRENETRA